MIDRNDRPRQVLSIVSLPTFLLLFIFIISTSAVETSRERQDVGLPIAMVFGESQTDSQPAQQRLLHPDGEQDDTDTMPDAQSALVEAVHVMQSRHFTLWQGTWPAAIDWTAAVLGTHVSATLRTLTSTFDRFSTPLSSDSGALENLINRYFLQTTTFYFGENAFSLRNQAYDDMLWVVLGWLENVKLINLHSRLHYSQAKFGNTSSWHGEQFVPAAAHRARIFYELASQGWDTQLCGGGMVWNPYLTPYKNAITNELYIAASVSMYLYFPGDDITSPFFHTSVDESVPGQLDLDPAKPHNPQYLAAAVKGYKWLKGSNMTDDKGLYVDGFHIRGWHRNPSNGTEYPGTGKCDVRNEMVYTYNQGVLLTGLRGLWIATCTRSYLFEGHLLISNVIAATGWGVVDGKWKGLGRDGVMEEVCDASGNCSQNGHTFKGIFFHHLSEFCRPPSPDEDRFAENANEFAEAAEWHARECSRYRAWVVHNAKAAYMTRNKNNEIGTWWGRRYPSSVSTSPSDHSPTADIPDVGIDYRNAGVPENDTVWDHVDEFSPARDDRSCLLGCFGGKGELGNMEAEDVNDRGRGRTVETQSGGVAVLRAYLEWTVGHVRR